LCAIGVWMHHQAGRIKYMLPLVTTIHFIQTSLLLLPTRPLESWIVQLPAILFYSATILLLCHTMYTLAQKNKRKGTDTPLISFD
jgi:hypothetical protein